jgi:squalene monooxygenase
MTPTKKQEVKDIMLKYPAYDPETAKELFGVILPGESSEGGDGVVSPKGRSFHNGRFVQRLRERALAEPNVTVVEGIVSKLLQDESGRVVGVEYKVDKQPPKIPASEGPTAGGGDAAASSADASSEPAAAPEKEVKQAFAALTVVADGLWSSLRTHVDKGAKPHQLSSFVGLIIQHPPMASPLPHRGCGHVVLAEPSPVLLYQISSTETRVLVRFSFPFLSFPFLSFPFLSYRSPAASRC